MKFVVRCSMYRSAFLSFRSRSKQTLNFLQRVDPSKRCQSRGYAKSARETSERSSGQKLLSETHPSTNYRSLMAFAIPIAFLGVAGYARYNDERRATQKGEGGKEAITSKGPTIGGPFNLINTERQTVTERDLLGHWVLLYFGYTSSPDVGPAELQKLAKAIDILESEQNVKVLPVFVTIDPQRDSPSQLKAYLGEFDPRILGLTGPVNSIRQMAQEYRVFFKKVEEDGSDYLVESSHTMYLMNPNMEIMERFGLEYSATEMAEAIAKVLKKSAT
ncbi:protein SCO1 homolog 2, mitochondrial [Beta vulgaris subsp. vulgaris]|uniref:protein SCO1 homolog 2, mitochondrial n=1 Tax=Beta vulgaris subsp. vulgaris TaxID=3555 RepID=UPI0020374961|nr:protein SCO1 homolog 2, mitochondrial [Beta vulgaris subsp. vulgaris]